MNIVSDLNHWQAIRRTIVGCSIGFVPTMGNLHEGHAALCARAKKENDLAVVSIFVNPTQFNLPEDMAQYPKTLAADAALLKSLQVDYVLTPSAETLYPDHYEMQIQETHIATELEGAFRPGHFTGMLTVVLKLFNLVQANRAYFGEKDYQQLLLVKKMASSLFVPTEVIACPTIRAEDGLALSSRNGRLSAEQRRQAALLPKLLMSSLKAEEIIQQLVAAGFRVEYVEARWQRRLAAVWLGDVRLIDNIPITPEDAGF